MIALFSALGVDLPSIALIGLHSLYDLSCDPTSPLLSFMFVRYSGNLIVHLWQGGRGRVSGSEIISYSHLFQYLCWNRLCIDSVSSRGYVV